MIGVTRDREMEPVGEGGTTAWLKRGGRARRNMAVDSNYNV
jgi:hypothetical protein